MRAFADHFSRLATGYAAYRPRYPEGLFAAIAAASPFRDRVWDCATGTGQAAHGLAAHFAFRARQRRQQAADTRGPPHDRVRYFVARGGGRTAALAARSGMVTVAQALHWLELPEFYAEARRVLRPGGLLVVWTYGSSGSTADRWTLCWPTSTSG